MRRPVILALSVALIVLVFAPIADAQANYQGGGNQGMGSGGTDDMGMKNNMGMGDNMMASPASSASTTAMSSASAPASATASPSASQTASASASASAPGATSSASAAPSNELPDTGGIPLAPLLSVGAFVFLAGSGVFTARLMRRVS
jgi:hypothetical protein